MAKKRAFAPPASKARTKNKFYNAYFKISLKQKALG